MTDKSETRNDPEELEEFIEKYRYGNFGKFEEVFDEYGVGEYYKYDTRGSNLLINYVSSGLRMVFVSAYVEDGEQQLSEGFDSVDEIPVDCDYAIVMPPEESEYEEFEVLYESEVGKITPRMMGQD